MKNRVSVILPTYNRADLISETIESLLAQTRPIDEILVIDDGSTDDTKRRVTAFGDKVRYHYKENGGKSAALNVALTMIEGDCVWICDDDDLILPDACARLMQELERDPELDYCAGLHQDFVMDQKSGEKVCKTPGYTKASQPAEVFSDALDGCHIFQPGLIVRRAFYDAVGPFNESLKRSQDYEMLLRLTRSGNGLVVPHVVFLHREHQGKRGAAGERFSMRDANQKWIKYHRQIIKPLLDEVADEELVPADVWNDPELVEMRHRTAKIRKGSVFGRHVLWEEAIAAWATIDAAPDASLSDYEIQLIRRSTGYGLGCAPLVDSTVVKAQLRELKRQSAFGSQIVRHLGRSVGWRIRHAVRDRKIGQALKLAGFMMSTR